MQKSDPALFFFFITIESNKLQTLGARVHSLDEYFSDCILIFIDDNVEAVAYSEFNMVRESTKDFLSIS